MHELLLSRLAETTGRTVDIAYAAIVHQLGITQRFFQEGGFGDLNVINFHEDISSLSGGSTASWPPTHFADIPIEWRRAQKDQPKQTHYSILRGSFKTPCKGTAYDALPAESRVAHLSWVVPKRPAPGNPTVIHLAATGDHGFARREALSIPLAIEQGVGAMILESPFYGLRRPAHQQGAKLHHVSDLLLLGRATIEETLFLLEWLQHNGDVERKGIAGLSMGGVHACMAASLYPKEAALVPLLAPRSAAAAYCNGALFHATGWKRLIDDTKKREKELRASIERASVSRDRITASRVLFASQQEHGNGRKVPTGVSQLDADFAAAQDQDASAGKYIPESKRGHGPEKAGTQARHASIQNEQSQQPSSSWIEWPWIASWSKAFRMDMEQVMQQNAAYGDKEAFKKSVMLLEAVLETYTDVTRFPVPQRPDATVIVAATDDAYVSRESVLEMHEHFPGSEVRWVPGGHVTSFVLHQAEFRKAIRDAIMTRL